MFKSELRDSLTYGQTQPFIVKAVIRTRTYTYIHRYVLCTYASLNKIKDFDYSVIGPIL